MNRLRHPVWSAAVALFVAAVLSYGSTEIDPTEGIQTNLSTVFAFTGGTIVSEPGKRFEGTVVIRDGLIEAVGAGAKVPMDATIIDAAGYTIYPGLIDLGLSYGLREVTDDTTGSAHWNARVRADRDVSELFIGDETKEASYRKAGFTSGLVTPRNAVFSGMSAFVSLAETRAANRVLATRVAQGSALRTFSGGGFPNSLMGTIALQRQTLLDAKWYRDAMNAYAARPVGQNAPNSDTALEALGPVIERRMPVLMKVGTEWNALRAARVAREGGIDLIVQGSGYEYRRLDAIRALDLPFVLPVSFPQAASDVPNNVSHAEHAHGNMAGGAGEPIDEWTSDAGDYSKGGERSGAGKELASGDEAMYIDLRRLRHMILAPENPARMKKAGVRFALTTDGLKDVGSFRARLRDAIDAGLLPDDALAALTTIPAGMVGQADRRGTLSQGKAADLLLVEGDLFDKKAEIREVWIGGKRHQTNPRPPFDAEGVWNANLKSGGVFDVIVSKGAKKASVKRGEDEFTVKHWAVNGYRIEGAFNGGAIAKEGMIQLDAVKLPDEIAGTLTYADGSRESFRATYGGAKKPDEDEDEEDDEGDGEEGDEEEDDDADNRKSDLPSVAKPVLADVYPSGAFGFEAPPAQADLIFVQGATIWTCGAGGVIENGDMIVRKGKIERVGTGLSAPGGAITIDAGGKHVTPGLIDCHSHSGVSGAVNEGSQAVSAEVRIADVINPDHIALYRQIAGGLTVANQLHGSANPIGGQNSVIKLRWSRTDDEMRFKSAKQGIKFALGENVKQSNWGDNNTTRYPQTRMGVPEIIRDRFQAALEYRRAFARHQKASKHSIPPRRDLELDALAEILEGTRLIHCHSYRQDEILGLVRIADEFGFTIGTFQHVLEGYKVAEAIADHGAGASTFSDWWGYKYEVIDAIPYNGALMHEVGVNVSFNSDSHQLARQLNWEAAKAVKYGGVSEEEALKFVTLNPAIQLHVDDRVGSLEPGKDADFVIWSGHPLSTMSRCEQTFIDGTKYFDIDRDHELRKRAKEERQSIIQYLLAKKGDGASRNKKAANGKGH